MGAGTGSVSCALAMAAFRGQVYAVEREVDAVALIEENRASFGLSNLHVVLGEAPKALLALPKPDRVFVGGSGGEMEEIFRAALAKNPAVRICLTAVSLESLTQGLRVFEGLGLQNVDVTQLTAAQAKVLGSYHMMLGQNPVYILSGRDSHDAQNPILRPVLGYGKDHPDLRRAARHAAPGIKARRLQVGA